MPVEIATAVTAALNAATLSINFTAVRSYADWTDKLEDLDTLQVDVVPLQTVVDTQLASHAEIMYRWAVDVGVRKRFSGAEITGPTGSIEIDEIDALVLLVEEIHEHLTAERLSDYTDAAWFETQLVQAYNRKQLREWNQFTGITRVVFDATKTY